MIGERILLAIGKDALGEPLRRRVGTVAARYGLSVVADGPDVICAADGKVQASVGETGAVVMGDVFHRSPFGPTCAPLSTKDLAESARTRAAFLIERCWGSYLALTFGSGEACVTRAPFGRLPLYFTKVGCTIVGASDAELLLEAVELRPSIDWGTIAQHLLANQLREAATGIEGVQELLPGFRLGATRQQPEMVWTPRDHCRPNTDLAPQALSHRLRQITDCCVGTWSRTYDRVVLGVSGGLDSSVVAASAMAAGARVSCLTLVTSDPAGDERSYARDLTDFLGTELHEFIEDPREIDLRLSAAAHLPRPTARSFAQSGDRRNLELAKTSQATAFFSGGGGDNVFCYLQSVSPFVDALLDLGPSRRTWQTARDLASLTGASIWEIARRGTRRSWGKQREFVWRMDRSFLSDECARPVPVGHPWLASASGLPPGKQAHIALLMYVQNHLDGYGREKVLPVISPLLSQPLVEFCLSVPTWLWLDGGLNRALVRRAYSDALPARVLSRRSKGTPDPYIVEIFETHREVVREMLLGGLLADQGLLDIAAIEQATSDQGPARGLAHYRLLKLVDVEAWLRSWRARA